MSPWTCFRLDWKCRLVLTLSTGWTSLQRLDWEAARLPVNPGEGKLHPQQGDTRLVTACVLRHSHSQPFFAHFTTEGGTYLQIGNSFYWYYWASCQASEMKEWYLGTHWVLMTWRRTRLFISEAVVTGPHTDPSTVSKQEMRVLAIFSGK